MIYQKIEMAYAFSDTLEHILADNSLMRLISVVAYDKSAAIANVKKYRKLGYVNAKFTLAGI